MVNPGGKLALLLLGLFSLVGIIFWFFKAQVNKFVAALLQHRQKAQEASQVSDGAEVTGA